eukprot:1476393-Prymnesium_polylepis.1
MWRSPRRTRRCVHVAPCGPRVTPYPCRCVHAHAHAHAHAHVPRPRDSIGAARRARRCARRSAPRRCELRGTRCADGDARTHTHTLPNMAHTPALIWHIPSLIWQVATEMLAMHPPP